MTHPKRPAAGRAGFTLVELLIVMAIIAVISAIAVAGYRHARVKAGEVVAMAALQTINQAQFSFSQTCGDQRFSPTLAGLAVPAPTTGQGFISPDLAGDPIVKSGYQFVMTGTPTTDGRLSCNGLTPVTSYQVSADPTAGGVSGALFYATNTDRTVFADTATFAGNMPETGAPGHGSEVK
ncbi:MAG: prepilin-type N-terminal cleavage/methylation domain-containing protein [Vicinamibacterales bacterium]